MKYSSAFRSKMVRRMTGSGALSANALARETGLSQPTLSQWLREAGGGKVSDMKKRRRPCDWTAEERFEALVEAGALSEEDRGGFLRRRGLRQANLDEWRTHALTALGSPRKSKTSSQARRVRELEKELTRKEKALAETAALLVLKKKAQAIWGDVDDNTTPRSGR